MNHAVDIPKAFIFKFYFQYMTPFKGQKAFFYFHVYPISVIHLIYFPIMYNSYDKYASHPWVWHLYVCVNTLLSHKHSLQ